MTQPTGSSSIKPSVKFCFSILSPLPFSIFKISQTTPEKYYPLKHQLYLPACAAAELIKTGVGAINRTGAPRPVLAPGPTTKAPV